MTPDTLQTRIARLKEILITLENKAAYDHWQDVESAMQVILDMELLLEEKAKIIKAADGLREALGLYQAAQADFDHGDDVNHMLRYGEAVEKTPEAIKLFDSVRRG